MVATIPVDFDALAHRLQMPVAALAATVEMLDDGNTVPFITRYRKDQTGGLDEEKIREIQQEVTRLRTLEDRKQKVRKVIDARQKLSPELDARIRDVKTVKELEEIYQPFRPKKQTLATLARQRGLETLADQVLQADPTVADLKSVAAAAVTGEEGLASAEQVLAGVGHLLAERFHERIDVRGRLRAIFAETGLLRSERMPESAELAGDGPVELAFEVPHDTLPDPHDPLAPDPLPPDTRGLEPASTDHHDNASETASASLGPIDELALAEAEEADGDEADPEDGVVEDSVVEDSSAEDSAADENTAEEPAAEASEEGMPEEGQSAAAPADGSHAGQPAAPVSVPSDVGQSGADMASANPEAPSANPAAPSGSPAADARGKGKKRDARKVTAVGSLRALAVERKKSKREAKQKKRERLVQSFKDYFRYSEPVRKIQHHRILAINRGERSRILRVVIEADSTKIRETAEQLLVAADHPHRDFLLTVVRDALQRLIVPSLEREVRRELTESAESHAVSVFARNLRSLILQPPLRHQRILAVDPGFRSGCKLVALDECGNVLAHGVVHLIGSDERCRKGRQEFVDLIRTHELKGIAIGNGTACREAERMVADVLANELKDVDVGYTIVNEAGASVYSTSQVGREELPQFDATLRGAVSIGRRLQDPLSELVKINPANIGVGLYQHDVKSRPLHSTLDAVVESGVNFVGVDLNTASPSLLRYVSGLNQLTARRIVEFRQQRGRFVNRHQLREVPSVGEATFVQAAGFLKITDGDNPLDATWIHPESYGIVEKILDILGITLPQLVQHLASTSGGELPSSPDGTPAPALPNDILERLAQWNIKEMADQLGVGELTLTDILSALSRPPRDPREDLPKPVFRREVVKLEDLRPGMQLAGTVLNVVDFGAFVDIGLSDCGLVHVSRLADRFVADPHDVVTPGDVLQVWVVDVDKERRRVSLTAVQPGTEKPRAERGARNPRQSDGQRPAGQPRTGGQGRGGAQRPQGASGSDAGAGATAGAGQRSGGQRSGGQRPGGQRPGGQRPGGQRSGGQPRSGGQQGQRSGQSGGRRDSGPKRGKTIVAKSSKPIAPITDAMKEGKEPMRTFADLMQFFEIPPNENRKGKPGRNDGDAQASS